MRLRYTTVYLINIFAVAYSCYYLTVFSRFYHYTQIGWVFGGISSLIIDSFGIMLILPLLGSIFRQLARQFRFLRFLKYWSYIDEINFYIHN